jgi:hypothetical protein
MTRNAADEIESGGASLNVDEDTGKAFWRLWGADWKDGQDMGPDEPIILNPDTFPPGTRVVVIEPSPDTPAAQNFYRNFGVKS